MKKIICSILISFTLAGTHAQVYSSTHIAGCGTYGYAGDNGNADSAKLWNPMGIAADAAGNVFFADNMNYRIRKITPSGIISTVAGTGTSGYGGDGGPATAATISRPYGVAFDAAGNLYFADLDNGRVRKISTSGIITTVAGNGTSGCTVVSGTVATATPVGGPQGICLDPAGNLYIAQSGCSIVSKVSTSGIYTILAGNNTIGFSGDGGPATAANLYEPTAVAVDPAGNVYITDNVNRRIRKVDPSGIITTIAGNGSLSVSGDGGPATAAGISGPNYIALDHFGNLYFTAGSTYIRKINSSGIINKINWQDDGVSGPGNNGIFVDDMQNIYSGISALSMVSKLHGVSDYTSDSFSIYINQLCSGPEVYITANEISSTLSLKTNYGDGNSSTVPLTAGTGGSFAVLNHPYPCTGTYTVKNVLFNGTTPIDSITFPYKFIYCRTLPIKYYFDQDANCTYNTPADQNMFFPVATRVDSNGIPIDTISVTSGLNYSAYGSPDDIYTFQPLIPSYFSFTCSGTGTITDTLKPWVYNTDTKYVGLTTNPTSVFDLALSVNTQTGRHMAMGTISVNNGCSMPAFAVVTMEVDPKYVFESAVPAPVSIVGNTVTWDLGPSFVFSPIQVINFSLNRVGVWLIPGDTIGSVFHVSPTIGDVDTSNNTKTRIDTVKSSFDPNFMNVSPQGYILPGTQLEYGIEFENTGNDTAHNIYVMDTLSAYLDPKSIRVISATAAMEITPYKDGAYDIVRFDFPAINLLDSSHHNQCDGMVKFTIKTREGLPNGTLIPNWAGIFFDDNPVVTTDTVVNIINMLSLQTAHASLSGNVSVYPNPATDELTIKMDVGAYSSYVITNVTGQVITSRQLTNNVTKEDISHLPQGLYYITLRGVNGTKVQKFVKM